MYTFFCELLKVPEFSLSKDNILPFIKYLALEIRLKQSSIKVKIMNLKKKIIIRKIFTKYKCMIVLALKRLDILNTKKNSLSVNLHTQISVM